MAQLLHLTCSMHGHHAGYSFIKVKAPGHLGLPQQIRTQLTHMIRYPQERNWEVESRTAGYI